MANKIKVFVDFDSTIVDSVKRFVEIANEKYGENKSQEDLGTYNFLNMYPSITKEEIRGIFAMDEFFDDKLEYMPNALFILNKYSEDFDMYLSTASFGRNLELKKDFVSKNLKFIKGVRSSVGNDKSSIDMKGSIQIDDIYECLEYTNAKIKILYKNNKNYKWQRHNDDSVYNVNEWLEIGEMLEYYLKEGVN